MRSISHGAPSGLDSRLADGWQVSAGLVRGLQNRQLICCLIAFLSLIAWPGLGYGDEGVTSKNWRNHPEIVEVRNIYKSVREAIDSKKLQKDVREFDYCEPYVDTVRVLYVDHRGVVRNYYFSGGSDDSAMRRDLYYDLNGKLRFAFIQAAAANGTRIEHRIYFSPDGRRLWEMQSYRKGPGYTFPTEWPEEDLIRDPKKAFETMSPCKRKVKKQRASPQGEQAETGSKRGGD